MRAACAGCGAALPQASRFCPYCGLQRAEEETRIVPEAPTRPGRGGAADATRMMSPPADAAPSWRARVRGPVLWVLLVAATFVAGWWLARFTR